jgi:hypothetical protein
MKINMDWAKEKQQALGKAFERGFFVDLASRKGGTGEYRRPLTAKERARKKKRRQMAKASRKRNRRAS